MADNFRLFLKKFVDSFDDFQMAFFDRTLQECKLIASDDQPRELLLIN